MGTLLKRFFCSKIILLISFVFLFQVIQYNQIYCAEIDFSGNNLSPDEKAGQMLMFGVMLTAQTDYNETISFLLKNKVGGIILSPHPMLEPSKIRGFVQTLQAKALSTPPGLPLLVAVDQEGGVVRHVRQTTEFPGNMALGAADDTNLTKKIAKALGTELLSLGINFNFAPVVDVNSNPNNPIIGSRSFSEDVDRVIRHGLAFLNGSSEAGIVAAIKHFPGHGDTRIDSHEALPSVNYDRDRLDKIEFKPFRELISKGAPAVMTAHITFPKITGDPKLPATLSDEIISKILRQQFKFDGVVVCDDLEMKAIIDYFSLRGAVIKAVLAGDDILLFGLKRERQEEAAICLQQAVRDQVVSSKRLDESVSRILKLKRWLQETNGDAAWGISTKLASVRSLENLKLAAQASRLAITVVQDFGHKIPLSSGQSQKVFVLSPKIEYQGDILGRLVKEYYSNVTVVESTATIYKTGIDYDYKFDGFEEEQQEVDAAIQRADLFICGLVNERQLPTIKKIAKMGKPLIVLSFTEPYYLADLTGVDTFIAAYSPWECSVRAAVDVLFGREKASGSLPVSIPGTFELNATSESQPSIGLYFLSILSVGLLVLAYFVINKSRRNRFRKDYRAQVQKLIANSKEDFSPVPEAIESEYPLPIAYLHRKAWSVRPGAEQFLSIMDLAEVCVRYLAALSLSCLHAGKKNSWEGFHSALKTQIDRPASFGKWLEILRESARKLTDNTDAHASLMVIPAALFDEKGRPSPLLEGLNEIVEIRNRYRGHGVAVDENKYKELSRQTWLRLQPLLFLLQEISQWRLTKFVEIEGFDGKVYRCASLVAQGAQTVLRREVVGLKNPVALDRDYVIANGVLLEINPWLRIDGPAGDVLFLESIKNDQVTYYSWIMGKRI